MPTIFIIIASLLALIFFHELGHFLLAKKFGVKVEEFGIGIPPRIFGKKIGETIYSINLLPLGGFVKLYGEDKAVNDNRSFSSKPLYQRAWIIFGGVAAFFIIAFIIFSLYSGMTGKTSVLGNEGGHFGDSKIVIREIVSDSPAEEVGLREGDILLEIDGKEADARESVIFLLSSKEGEETEIVVQRGEEVLSFSLMPRVDYSKDEGAVGIAMTEVFPKYPLYLAPIYGAKMTGETTFMTISGFTMLISSIIPGVDLPDEMRVGGPVVIVNIGADFYDQGFQDYLGFLGIITISLAVLNILPIPALDGGRLVFLAIEGIKGRPLPESIEYGLNTIFFFLLIVLMIFITLNDLKLL